MNSDTQLQSGAAVGRKHRRRIPTHRRPDGSHNPSASNGGTRRQATRRRRRRRLPTTPARAAEHFFHAMLKDAMSGDYDHLLRVLSDHCEPTEQADS